MITRKVSARETVILCDSPADFARATVGADRDDNESWTGSTRGTAVDKCIRGDETLVPEAESLLRKLETEIAVPHADWTPAPCGAYAIVPEYLVGHPDCMRRRRITADETTPIRVYVDLTSSGGVQHDKLTKRGIGFLALIMALIQQRPVEASAVIALGYGQSGVVVIPLPTRPLDTAVACGVLTDGAVTRTLGYGLLHEKTKAGGGWYKSVHPHDLGRDEYINNLRAALACDPADIFIGPMYLDDPLVDDPVGFIRRMLAAGNSEGV